jgi:hypothetical protein
VFFFFCFSRGVDGVHLVLRPLFVLLYQPQVIDDGDCGAIGGMRIGRGNRSTWRKPATVPPSPPQFPHDLTRARTRAAAVGECYGVTSYVCIILSCLLDLLKTFESMDWQYCNSVSTSCHYGPLHPLIHKFSINNINMAAVYKSQVRERSWKKVER